MAASKLQSIIVSSSQFIDNKGASKERSSVTVQSVATRDIFKVKVPQLATTYVPLSIEHLTTDQKEKETVETISGKFGRFGGKFVPETLVTCLNQLEAEFKKALQDNAFQVTNLFIILSYHEFQIIDHYLSTYKISQLPNSSTILKMIKNII